MDRSRSLRRVVSPALARLALAFALAFASRASAVPVWWQSTQVPVSFQTERNFFVEHVYYDDYVYSQSRRTEIGDQVRLDAAVRYQYSPSTYGRLRFQTDPLENRFQNKTSEFEFLAGHKADQFHFQVDSALLTNEDPTGGTSLGFDVDSDLTFVRWTPTAQTQLTFYPFNFGGSVGREFNTWDVTRLFFVNGAPNTVNPTPLGSERIGFKTIPGLEFAIQETGAIEYRAWVGLGAASYFYPGSPSFDVETSPTSDRWERREDVGYKIGGYWRKPGEHRVEFRYVGHTKAAETGSLLEAAASLYAINKVGRWLFEAELAWSKAGSRPYRLNRDGTWFEQTAPFQPVYKDFYGTRQDWIGQADGAVGARVGYEIGQAVPYLSFKHQGANFIYRERESAHRLRTGDESRSHGGLDRVGFGAFVYEGDFLVNPQFEFLFAQNDVFGNSADVRQNRILSSFQRTDFLFFLTIAYRFGGTTLFKP